MTTDISILARVNELIGQSQSLRQGNQHGQAFSSSHRQECKGWLAAALNIAQIAIPDPNSAYRRTIESIASQDHGYTIHNAVGEVGEVLRNLTIDAEAGLLTSITDRVRADVFDDFLDHAKAYQHDGRKNEAGVISGVVFEDVIRRVSRKHEIEERQVRLDDLITSLAKAGVLSGTKAKRARVAAHVRTKATHAQWDEFDEDDLRTTIDFTEELIRRQVDE